MSYELFQQGPSVYIPVLLWSLLITIIAFAAFPIIFAVVRKKPVIKKKYKGLCYGINAAVLLLFMVGNGGSGSVAPYLLWTWIFSGLGGWILESKGVLTDGTAKPVLVKNYATELPEGGWRCSCGRGHPKYETSCICGKTKTDNLNKIEVEKNKTENFMTNNQLLFCRKCGEKLIDNSRFCRKCGTEVVEQ